MGRCKALTSSFDRTKAQARSTLFPLAVLFSPHKRHFCQRAPGNANFKREFTKTFNQSLIGSAMKRCDSTVLRLIVGRKASLSYLRDIVPGIRPNNKQ
jgi:hypothetical protein